MKILYRARHAVTPAIAATVFLLGACAEKPPAGQPDALAEYNERNDPFEPGNRKLFAVNTALDQNALRPVAKGYRAVTSAPVRDHLHNVLSNLGNPAQFTNDVLQGKPRKAGNTFMRLVINSTLGVGGVFDLAGGWGFPDHDNDFGLTLAVWGIPAGPFLFLPVLGPNDPRDAIGYGINSALDPLTWASFGGSATLGWTRFGTGAVVGRERVLNATDSINETALDPYATYRSLYQQNRESAAEAARKDLPATVPVWYAKPVMGVQPAPTDPTPPLVAPRDVPPPALLP